MSIEVNSSSWTGRGSEHDRVMVDFKAIGHLSAAFGIAVIVSEVGNYLSGSRGPSLAAYGISLAFLHGPSLITDAFKTKKVPILSPR